MDDVDEVTGGPTRNMHLQGLCSNTKSIKPDASTRSARPLEDPDKLMAGAYRIVTTTLLPTLRRVTEHWQQHLSLCRTLDFLEALKQR